MHRHAHLRRDQAHALAGLASPQDLQAQEGHQVLADHRVLTGHQVLADHQDLAITQG